MDLWRRDLFFSARNGCREPASPPVVGGGGGKGWRLAGEGGAGGELTVAARAFVQCVARRQRLAADGIQQGKESRREKSDAQVLREEWEGGGCCQSDGGCGAERAGDPSNLHVFEVRLRTMWT